MTSPIVERASAPSRRLVTGECYWTSRISDVVDQADNAPNPRMRSLYLELADYYRSMITPQR